MHKTPKTKSPDGFLTVNATFLFRSGITLTNVCRVAKKLFPLNANTPENQMPDVSDRNATFLFRNGITLTKYTLKHITGELIPLRIRSGRRWCKKSQKYVSACLTSCHGSYRRRVGKGFPAHGSYQEGCERDFPPTGRIKKGVKGISHPRVPPTCRQEGCERDFLPTGCIKKGVKGISQSTGRVKKGGKGISYPRVVVGKGFSTHGSSWERDFHPRGISYPRGMSFVQSQLPNLFF